MGLGIWGLGARVDRDLGFRVDLMKGSQRAAKGIISLGISGF